MVTIVNWIFQGWRFHIAKELSSSIWVWLIWKVYDRLEVSTCGVANLSFLMWFSVAFNGIIPTNVRDLSATWVWISVRKWKMFGRLFFFSCRVSGTEGRRANKLKHMWTLQSHNIDSLVGPALIIDADRFLAFFIYITIFFCETDKKKQRIWQKTCLAEME